MRADRAARPPHPTKGSAFFAALRDNLSSPPPSRGRSIAAPLRCDRERGVASQKLPLAPTVAETLKSRSAQAGVFCEETPSPDPMQARLHWVDLPHKGG